jgi:hypothetical protein
MKPKVKLRFWSKYHGEILATIERPARERGMPAFYGDVRVGGRKFFQIGIERNSEADGNQRTASNDRWEHLGD